LAGLSLEPALSQSGTKMLIRLRFASWDAVVRRRMAGDKEVSQENQRRQGRWHATEGGRGQQASSGWSRCELVIRLVCGRPALTPPRDNSGVAGRRGTAGSGGGCGCHGWLEPGCKRARETDGRGDLGDRMPAAACIMQPMRRRLQAVD